MKGQILKILQTPPKLTRRDWLWTLLPALVWWWGATYGRNLLIHPRCGHEPSHCAAAQVNAVDRIAIRMEDGDADGFSYLTQNTAGTVAIAAPLVFHAVRAAAKIVTPAAALMQAGVDLVLMAQTTSWNGTFIELSHILVQRPRPFVYSDPANRGRDSAHYTSFYSGHTSFVAAAMSFLFLTFLVRGAPFWLLAATFLSGQLLLISTAIFRVLAGRHFITDVVCAALAGIVIATSVAYLHRKP